MHEAQEKYFGGQHGWQALPGFGVQSVSIRGTIPEAALESAGVEISDYAKPARTDLVLMRFDNFFVSRISTRSITALWGRTRAPARRRYLLLLLNRGTVLLQGSTIRAVTGGGVGLLTPGDGPVTLEVPADAEGVIFTFDEREVESISLPPKAAEFTPSTAVFGPAYAFLSALPEAAAESANAVSPSVVRGLLQALAKGLLLDLASEPGTHRTDMFPEFVALLDQRYRTPSFGVPEILKELGVSRRVLERSVSARGTSVSVELRRRRAEHAKLLIETSPGLTLKAVSLQSGFSSIDALRSALMAFYNTTPSSLRGSARNTDS